MQTSTYDKAVAGFFVPAAEGGQATSFEGGSKTGGATTGL